jgi:hypothetical protein
LLFHRFEFITHVALRGFLYQWPTNFIRTCLEREGTSLKAEQELSLQRSFQ